MAPNPLSTVSVSFTGVLNETDKEVCTITLRASRGKSSSTLPSRITFVWRNVILFSLLHIGAVYGLYLLLIGKVRLISFAFAYMYGTCGGLGITAGAHRLWSHKSYKAKLPMRIMLAFFQTIALQNSIFEWSRDHRVHHKFTETDADPHNAKRGFFFAHMGWLLMRKHPDVLEKGKMVDMSDLEADPVIMFQKRHYMKLILIFSAGLPAVLPVIILGENLWYSFLVCSVFRYILSLHFTWLVNSAAHLWGSKPYDKNINPSENVLVSILSNGEGWHNYHHVFPWDYKTSELGMYRTNLTTLFIDICAKIGWAYDLKTVSPEVVKQRVLRTGDGSHLLWGWGDKDLTKEHKQVTETLYAEPNNNTYIKEE